MQDCFFFHNPKAGGTALRHALERYFRPQEIAPTRNLRPEVYGAIEANALPRGYRFYCGHYGFDQAQWSAPHHAMITNFRHPATRLQSLYEYFRYGVPDSPALRTRPEFFAVRLARSVDFETFVTNPDPRVLTYTSNHQYRQLANCGWSFSVTRSVADVCATIDEMAWFYVCEYPEMSLRWARAALGAPQFDIGRVNVTPKAADISSPLLEMSHRALDRVLEMNQKDLAIYSHALGRFFATLPSLGPR